MAASPGHPSCSHAGFGPPLYSCKVSSCQASGPFPTISALMRFDMRNGLRAIVLTSAAILGGCSEGVLNPQGPIAIAERQILLNALGIMLAIVIPVILATLGVAFWFRASNERARYRPNFTYSGRLEMLVWSIPAMTVFLVGGVAWVGSHDLSPRKPIVSTVKPLRVQVTSLDWKWLFIYPDEGVASVNYLAIPVGTPVSFELTSSGVMKSCDVPQRSDVNEGGKMNLLGKLNWSAIPFDQPIIMCASGGVVLVIVSILAWVTLKGYVPYLWREWITSVDHKRIGIMYIILALIMLLRGFADAIMMRAQQAVAAGGAQGYLPPEHFDQIFSAHGTIMIFFMAMPFVIGMMNFVVPLQLGVRDMAFPTLNSVALGLTASGILLTNISLAVAEFAKPGWVAYPPLSELQFSPCVGVDCYAFALQISGIGTLMTGINFVATILKTRAPGMGYMRMPVFCWTSLAANLLIVAAFPVLTATLAMLLLDRYLGFHFFTIDGQGNAMMYVNLFWVWGHPEVYILVLPAFGIFSEVVSTFSGKPLFGYRSMVAATMAICVLSFLVWLHHFFTIGAGANVNGFFGVMTMIIAVPTGVKVFNWLFTMYGGRVRFTVPILWSIGFMVTFVIRGMTGVLMAVPPADFQLHNSLFLVAHFHNVIIGGVVFGLMAGYNYWFPKAFGFKLDGRWGRVSFWGWLIGCYLAFMPPCSLGLRGS